MLLLFCFSKVAFKQEYQQNQQLYKIVKTKKLTGKRNNRNRKSNNFFGNAENILDFNMYFCSNR